MMIAVEGAQEKDASIGLDSLPLNRGAERQVGQIFHRRRRSEVVSRRCAQSLDISAGLSAHGHIRRFGKGMLLCFIVLPMPFSNLR